MEKLIKTALTILKKENRAIFNATDLNPNTGFLVPFKPQTKVNIHELTLDSLKAFERGNIPLLNSVPNSFILV